MTQDQIAAVLLIAGGVLITVGIVLACAVVQRRDIRRDLNGRSENCCVCGREVRGKDWWTVSRLYGVEEDESFVEAIDLDAEDGPQTANFGGSMMSADFCSKHKPADIPDGDRLTRHG